MKLRNHGKVNNISRLYFRIFQSFDTFDHIADEIRKYGIINMTLGCFCDYLSAWT